MTKLAIWDVTNRCNLRCIHCGVSDIYHRQATGLEVAYEEGLVILHRLHEAGYQRLMLLGGEPLMRGDIVELVAAACRVGFSHIGITTNGTRLTPQLADALLDAGLDDLVVSLEGATAQSHEQVRGRGTFARAMRGLEIVLQRRPSGSKLKIAILLTLSRPNLHETAATVDLAGRMGLDYLTINRLKLRGNARQNAERLLPSVAEVMDALEAALQAVSRYPGLGLEVFGRPRVIEYFNERFSRDLPITIPNCGFLSGQTICIAADGIVSGCEDAQAAEMLNGSGQETPLQAEYSQLQRHPFASILASAHFDPLRRIVHQSLEERWQDAFIPCVKCHYRPDCQLCPLFLRDNKDKMVPECWLAIRRLAQWRKSQARVETALLSGAVA